MSKTTKRTGFLEKILKEKDIKEDNDNNSSVDSAPNRSMDNEIQSIKEKALERKNKLEETITLVRIATKTGINADKLREIYMKNDGSGKIDLKNMEKDFDGGKGIKAMKDKETQLDSQKQAEQIREKTSFVERFRPNGLSSIYRETSCQSMGR